MATIADLPEVVGYGQTADEACLRAQALAFRAMAERVEAQRQQKISEDKLRDLFAGSILGIGILLALIYVLVFGLGPIWGSMTTVAAVILSLAAIIFVYGRRRRGLRVNRKEDAAVHCAYCKDVVDPLVLTECPECGTVYHHECLAVYGCSTFACSLSLQKRGPEGQSVKAK